MRLAELERNNLTERQRETYDRIANGPRQAVRGPFIAWLRSPVFADRAEAMGNYLRFDSSLPRHLNELAILMVAKSWHASFVWEAHKGLAIDAGLSDETIEAVRCNHTPGFNAEADRSAYAFLIELLNDKRVSDRTWAEAVASLGEQRVVDLLGIAGYYTMVVMTIVATDLAAGTRDPFTASEIPRS